MTKEGAMLVARERDRAREWPLAGNDPFIIGRDPDCDLTLPDRQVSRHHAVIRRRDGDFVVEDRDSKNGTWVNGVQVQAPARLKDGDELSIAARYKLYFVDADATAPMVFEGRGLRIDPGTLTVFVNGEPLDPPLSGPQYELLKRLYVAEGAMVSREDIVQHVWPESESEGVSEDALDALVRRVRLRLAEVDDEHQYIVTIRGYGFRLEMP